MRVTLALCALLLCCAARAAVVEGPIEAPEIPALPATLVPQSGAPNLADALSSPLTAASIEAAVPASVLPALSAAAASLDAARGEAGSSQAAQAHAP